MNYRFQKFTSLYPDAVLRFLAKHPGVESLSYREIYARVIAECYGWSNHFAVHLSALGNEAEDFFVFEPLQKAWAREHGVCYGEGTWVQDIVVAQIKAARPDVVFLQDLYLFDRAFRAHIRDVVPSVRLVGWRAAPTTDFSELSDLDMVMTSNREFVTELTKAGARCELMGHAFEGSLLARFAEASTDSIRFSFAGGVGDREGIHSQRYELIETLLRRTALEVWGKILLPPEKSLKGRFVETVVYFANRVLQGIHVAEGMRKAIPVVRRGAHWRCNPSRVSAGRTFAARFHPPVFGLDYFDLLRRSKISLNAHVDCAGAFVGNMRLFEVTGMGSCLMTDWKEDLADIFEPDEEVVTYRSAGECVEKVAYLLAHDEERMRIAAKGQSRTLRDHTYQVRAERLHEIIGTLLTAYGGSR